MERFPVIDQVSLCHLSMFMRPIALPLRDGLSDEGVERARKLTEQLLL